MGFKAWSKLSVLVLASAALAGCNSGPQKSGTPIGQQPQKTNPPVSGLASQKPDFPGQGASPFAQPNGNLNQQQKPLTVQPTGGGNAGQQFPTPPRDLQPMNNNVAPLPFPGQLPTTPNPASPTTNQSFQPPALPQPPGGGFGSQRDIFPAPPPVK